MSLRVGQLSGGVQQAVAQPPVLVSDVQNQGPRIYAPEPPLEANLVGGATVSATGIVLSAEVYRFRDQFLTDDAAPLAMPRTAEPGPGEWDGAAGGSDDSIANDRLTLEASTGSAWGANRIVGPSMIRTNGRTFAGVALLSDSVAKHGFGWYPGDPTGDPRTDGHGWTGYVTNGGEILAATPGGLKTIDAGQQNLRPIQYFIATVLTDKGAVHLISAPRADSSGGMTYPPGIPAYPNARVYWVETSTGDDEYLRPYVSVDDQGTFSLSMVLTDLRVVDVPSWTANDAIATFKDRFVRADSTTDPGPLWTAQVGQMGILGNALYYVSGAYGRVKNTNIGMTDGIWTYTVLSGSRADPQAIIDLRYVDDSNFIFFMDQGTTGATLFKKVGGVDTILQSTSFTWTANTTYRIRVAAYGNKYRVWVNETDVFGAWITDTGSNFLTATGLAFSLESVAPVGGKIRDVATYPATIALPLELRQGAKPGNDLGERTINADDFTDTNGVNLEAHTPTGVGASGGAWDDHATGNWTIQNNAVTPPPSGGSSQRYLTQAVAVGDYEAKVSLKTKTTIVDATDTILAGVAVRLNAAGDTGIYARALMTTTQIGADEIELWEVVSGVPTIINKVNLGDFWQQNSTYVMAVQTKGDLITVYLDDKPRVSAHIDTSVFTGTRAGLYHDNLDTGTTYDLWVAQNLPVSADIAGGGVVGATAINVGHALTAGLTADAVVGSDLTDSPDFLTANVIGGGVVTASGLTMARPLDAGLTADAVLTASRITESHAMALGLTADAAVSASSIAVGHAPTATIAAGGVVGATSITVGHAPTAALTAGAVVSATRITESHAMALALTADAVVGATRITEAHAMALGLTAGGVVGAELTVGNAGAALSAALAADAVVAATRLTTAHAMTLALTGGAAVGATSLTVGHAATAALTAGAVVGATAIRESHAMTLPLTAGAVVTANLAATLLGSLTARFEAVPLLTAALTVDPMVFAQLEAA